VPEDKYYIALSHEKGEIMRTLLLLLLALVAIGLITPNPIMAAKREAFNVDRNIEDDADARSICPAKLDFLMEEVFAGHKVTWTGSWTTDGTCYYYVD
jgi:hypothetical protein